MNLNSIKGRVLATKKAEWQGGWQEFNVGSLIVSTLDYYDQIEDSTRPLKAPPRNLPSMAE